MEHISHLHQLETLNLQNNWLTTQGKHERAPACQAAAFRNTPAATFKWWMAVSSCPGTGLDHSGLFLYSVGRTSLERSCLTY